MQARPRGPATRISHTVPKRGSGKCRSGDGSPELANTSLSREPIGARRGLLLVNALRSAYTQVGDRRFLPRLPAPIHSLILSPGAVRRAAGRHIQQTNRRSSHRRRDQASVADCSSNGSASQYSGQPISTFFANGTKPSVQAGGFFVRRIVRSLRGAVCVHQPRATR